jgi:hypothetical protein
MLGVRPSLQFFDSESIVAPEFYVDYPIYVNHEKYDDLKDEYHHIYKVYNGSSSEIQLVPEEYVGNRLLMSDIVRIVPYYVDSLGNEEVLSEGVTITYEDRFIEIEKEIVPEFTFEPVSGVVQLNSSFTYDLDHYLSYKADMYSDVNGYEGKIILEFYIEKYRDITVEREDVNLIQAHQIVTMQSAHQSIMEYLYQFTVAEQAQQRLDEISYTIFVTTISTLITMGATIGFDRAFGSITSTFVDKLDDAIWTQTAGKRAANLYNKINLGDIKLFNQLLNPLSRGPRYNLLKIAAGMISESSEEVMIDPRIDAYVNNLVADMGGDATAQIYWSGLAESGRESSLSLVTQFMWSSQRSQNVQNLQNMAEGQHLTIDQMNEMAQERQQAQTQEENHQEYLRDTVCTLVMFAGAMMSMLGSGDIAAFGNFMVIGGASADSILELKDTIQDTLALRRERKLSRNQCMIW